MYISRLALDHFRSWEHCVIDFTPNVNILHGANGLGKTNIVEAIEVMSTGSSHRTSSSLPLVERGAASATIRANVDEMNTGGMVAVKAGDAADAEANGGGSSDNAGTTSTADDYSRGDTAAIMTDFPAASGAGHSRAMHATTYEATIAARGANRARINGGPALYLRDIVGRIPSVCFTPEDQRLVTADPAMRRRFLDQAGALLVPGYMNRLQTCTRIAKQRSALLKQLERSEGDANAALSGLEIWTGQFIEAGIALTIDRQRIVETLREPFAVIYDALAGANRDRREPSWLMATDPMPQAAQAAESGQTSHAARLAYEPSFAEVFGSGDFDCSGDRGGHGFDPGEGNGSDAAKAAISRHFQRIYPGEVARGLNLIGPHRDDMSLELEGMPAREFASNGEMWTMALALKMALFEVVQRASDVTPIVILDDVFAQLDETRRRQILAFAAAQQQVFITVAARSDIPDFSGLGDAGMGNNDGVGITPNIIDVAQLKTSSHDGNDQLMAQLRTMRGGSRA